MGSRSELLGLGDLHGCSDPESSRCVFRTGGDAVDYYGFRNKPFSKAIVAILLISVALRTLAFIAFKCLFTGSVSSVDSLHTSAAAWISLTRDSTSAHLSSARRGSEPTVVERPRRLRWRERSKP